MKTLLILTPHMSTGGCPQVVAKKVELLKDYYNVIVVEWECVAWIYVVQRNRVIDMTSKCKGIVLIKLKYSHHQIFSFKYNLFVYGYVIGDLNIKRIHFSILSDFILYA
jgi:hypothetical protein